MAKETKKQAAKESSSKRESKSKGRLAAERAGWVFMDTSSEDQDLGRTVRKGVPHWRAEKQGDDTVMSHAGHSEEEVVYAIEQHEAFLNSRKQPSGPEVLSEKPDGVAA